MDNIKVTSVLKTFSKKEIQRFEDFLNSPYFNKGKKYISRFYKELVRFYPEFNDPDLKKHIYKKLYPGENYSDIRFRKLTSELYKLVLDFLSAENFINDGKDRNISILGQLNQRKLGNLFETELKNSYQEILKQDLRNDSYNKYMYELTGAEKFFYFPRKRALALDKYDAEINYFIKYTVSLFLSKYIERAMEVRFFRAKKFELPLFDEIVLYLKENDFLKDPVINILFLQLTLCLKDDDESYFKLRKLLKKTEKLVNKNQLKIIYTILSNYAVERSEKGTPGFLEEILDVNLEIIRKDLTEQYISGFLFINIVTLFLKFKKINELKKFISGNSALLNPEIRDAVLNYCNSCLSFYGKDYEKSLDHLSKISFDHYQLKFQIKNLTLKIYYETRQYEAIFSLMDSYKHILRRESGIPESLKKTILAFLKTLKDLSEKKAGNKKIDKDILKKEFENSYPAEKQWLKEKIDLVD